MKLYRVEVKEVLCVVARNEKDIEYVLHECDWGNGEKKVEAVQVNNIAEIPEDWKTSIPIGREDDNPEELTCEEIIDPRARALLPLQPIVVTVLEPQSEEAKVEKFKKAIEKLAKEMGIDARCEE